jgi:serpin B
VVGALRPAQVALSLPRFTFRSRAGLGGALQQMGMATAFRAGAADFSGMDGSRDLVIGDVIHEAFVKVDEQGTEAAAATAVVMKEAAAPAEPIPVRVDRPFLFFIRDRETGAVLFLGRVVDPSAG